MVSLNFSPAYPNVQSPTTPGQQSYPGGITYWSRASFILSPLWQGPSSHAPWLLHRSNALIGLLRSVLPSETQQ
ncbi:zinc finger ccch domain-containing protein zfn-like [Quercus suber]|uniref:Zinc finger ccch domain-containing protein zfn-like n=1 Tax=Quercus suber TaxID=58331 RepID=A0AAW0LIA7_QUESU